MIIEKPQLYTTRLTVTYYNRKFRTRRSDICFVDAMHEYDIYKEIKEELPKLSALESVELDIYSNGNLLCELSTKESNNVR